MRSTRSPISRCCAAQARVGCGPSSKRCCSTPCTTFPGATTYPSAWSTRASCARRPLRPSSPTRQRSHGVSGRAAPHPDLSHVNFLDALRYLDEHINLEAVAGRIEGLSLDRMRALMEILGDPQRSYPAVHVTGTNGKGSTTFMISALLHARGLSVGTFASPHVETINERIRWNLEPIDDDA